MRLIDANALIDHLRKDPLFCFVERYGITGFIEATPTIDAVPVVRCKDCKWWREETDHTCRKWGGASPRNANGYCDDAEEERRMSNFAKDTDVLISREMAIQCLEWGAWEKKCDKEIARAILMLIPSDDPGEKGTWIEDEYTRQCSSCGRIFWRWKGDPWTYCPECGSRNVQEPEEDAR